MIHLVGPLGPILLSIVYRPYREVGCWPILLPITYIPYRDVGRWLASSVANSCKLNNIDELLHIKNISTNRMLDVP